MKPNMILFGAYEPDKPPHLHNGLVSVGNVYSSSAGKRPVGRFSPITPAMPEAYTGGAAYVASDGSASLIGGTIDALHRYAGGEWHEIASEVTGPYPWSFTQFGDTAIAVNGGITQAIDLRAGTADPLGGDPPAASCVATVRDFVVYGQAGGDQSMVQWSGFNDATSNIPGEDMAGFQPMQEGGPVMGIVGGEYGLIVQRRRVTRMSFTGDPDAPFQFDPVVNEVGAIASGSIVNTDRRAFFLSDRGFMMCDGNEVAPIGIERVDATFFARHPRSTLSQITAAVDPRRTVVAWMMPGNPGRMWLYNWSLDEWSIIETGARGVLSGFTANISLEELDVIYPGGIDTIPYSLDDERWAGGDPLFLIVSRNSEMGTLSGENMAAWVQTGLIEINNRRRARIRSIVPVSDAINGVSISIDSRQRLGDVSSVKRKSVINQSGKMPVRSNGMFNSYRIDIRQGVKWSFLQGVEIETAIGGGR